MTKRQQFVDYVKNGGKQFCSPQIGAGAGFDTKLAGKTWIGETTFEDTKAAIERFDILPLYNFGIDPGMVNPELQWKVTATENTETMRKTEMEMVTKAGTITQTCVEEPIKGGYRTKCPMTSEDELGILEYYVDATLDGDFSTITNVVKSWRNLVGEDGVLDVQWAVQPYEMFCLYDTVNTVMIVMDYEDQCKKIMEKVLEFNRKAFKAVKAGGADFVFLGGPGSEMISPRFYKDFLIPYSKITTSDAHNEGLLIYSHICSPIEPFLTMGFYNEMGMDLFETLSPAPVGNVESIADALTKLEPRICTRGNIGLDVLLTQTPEVVRQKTIDVIEQSRGRKHIVAASDYLFYDIPEENLHAMVDACKEFC